MRTNGVETTWMGRGAWWWRKNRPTEECGVCGETLELSDLAVCECGKRVHAGCMRTCEQCRYYGCSDCVAMAPDGRVLCQTCLEEYHDGQIS